MNLVPLTRTCPCCHDSEPNVGFDAEVLKMDCIDQLVDRYGSLPCETCADDALFCDDCNALVENLTELDDLGRCVLCSPYLGREWADGARADAAWAER